MVFLLTGQRCLDLGEWVLIIRLNRKLIRLFQLCKVKKLPPVLHVYLVIGLLYPHREQTCPNRFKAMDFLCRFFIFILNSFMFRAWLVSLSIFILLVLPFTIGSLIKQGKDRVSHRQIRLSGLTTQLKGHIRALSVCQHNLASLVRVRFGRVPRRLAL